MPIEVRQPGLATTIQDAGRNGYYDVGIPPSGALDQYSYSVANRLVGNDPGAAVLECVYMGPELHFTEDTVIAITGAELPPKLNGEERPLWEAFAVKAGDVLTFGFCKRGARAYIAVSGGVDVPVVLGSRSTYGLGKLGGISGAPLVAGDVIPVGAGTGVAGRALPESLRPALSKEIEVRVVMGLYDHVLTDAGRATFLDTDWTLTPVADRVGFRYQGAQLETKPRTPPFGAGQDPSNIVDAPYPIGSIQVPGGVEPIILHRDAVSGGGYMMVGTVLSGDLDLVAQSAPNTRTRFVAVELDEALAIRREYRARTQRAAESLI
ncbi:biotin-dependent carboxyltransferase family protein [Amycolatopsis sp. Poz14]|uniref:5-oxoprolinase subunit C family protein n=1 Tax=Amycolatopsis sp. Poz14 TaxID=1447705 RepID=UPI001EE7C689|nr:biotin-dependent carboxyltransferase family protein [Amycolatopsis sp. Poz14]MCG3755704.1 biotin-dependent carboxyltransferase [Amycolatopsis sp. Poz14]